MLRPPGSYLKASIAAAGWFAAPGHPGYVRLAAITVALGLSGAAVNVLNDLLDRDKDAVTAPELPLPSGMVTLLEALVVLGVLVLVVLAGVLVASMSILRFFLGLVPMIAACAVVAAYSLCKPVWIGPPLLAATAYVMVPLDAWVVAGGGGDTIALVLAYSCCFGFAANFLAALRDAANDPAVGNKSVAVRFGVDRTLLGAMAFDLSGVCWAAAIAWSIGNLDSVAPWAISVGVLVAASYAWVWRRRRGIADGRSEGLAALRPANFARWSTVVLLVGVFAPPVAAVVAVVTILSLGLLIPAYRRRILRGELRAEMFNEVGVGAPQQQMA